MKMTSFACSMASETALVDITTNTSVRSLSLGHHHLPAVILSIDIMFDLSTVTHRSEGFKAMGFSDELLFTLFFINVTVKQFADSMEQSVKEGHEGREKSVREGEEKPNSDSPNLLLKKKAVTFWCNPTCNSKQVQPSLILFTLFFNGRQVRVYLWSIAMRMFRSLFYVIMVLEGKCKRKI